MFKVPEKYRLKYGLLKSTEADGNNGLFQIQSINYKKMFNCIASDEKGWEHVSVTVDKRCPEWNEMCFIKSKFWSADDFVVQMHPPQKDWINNHRYCLHLWRKSGTNDFCKRPPSILVGV